MAAVEARAGGDVPGGVEAAIRTTLYAFGAQLTHTPAAVANALGEDLVAELESGRRRPPVEPEELVTSLARKLRTRTSVALEVVESVIAELAARVGPVARQQLRRTIAPAWAALVVDPPPRSTDVHAPVPPRQANAERTLAAARPPKDTLATGKPGSKHPLVDAE